MIQVHKTNYKMLTDGRNKEIMSLYIHLILTRTPSLKSLKYFGK